MFRNKILVRAHLPSPSFYHFLVRQLSLTDASSLIEIETLCWKLSRRWRLSCFHPSPSSVFVIYQRSQTDAAARVVEELVKTLSVCNVGEEAVEVRSAILIARAVECWFRSLMLEKCWRCIGDSTFVDSTFACDEEKKYFQALEVRVQSEIDGLVFIVSPDVIWFVRDKITDLVASRALQSWHDGNVALVEKDRLFTACLVLPSLYNGHILGLNKLPPAGEKIELLEELWKFKHGLSLSSDYYVNVHFSYGGQASKQWSSFFRRISLVQNFTLVTSDQHLLSFPLWSIKVSVIYRLPSAFVLRGSGLSPAPQTVRYSMAVNALNFFINTIGCSDFFSQGLLKVKEVSSLETPMMQPVWKSVGTVCNDNNKSITTPTDESLTSQNLHLTLDFRTRKPALWFISANRMLDYDTNHSSTLLSSDGMTETTTTCVFEPPVPKPLNEVVQVATKPPSLSQSQTYQRGKYFTTKESGQFTMCKLWNSQLTQFCRKLLLSFHFQSSNDLRDKMMSDTLNHGSSSKDEKAEKNEALSKRTSDKENKISLVSPT